MKKILFFIIALICSGCASVDKVTEKTINTYDYYEDTFSDAMEEISIDYLKANELSSERMREAGREFKYDILGANKPVIDKKQAKAAILKAKKTLSESEHKMAYLLKSAKIDKEIGMPDTRNYVFVHFSPIKDNPDISGETYLVVINRFYDIVVYSGIFSPSKGDPFYKYADVLKEIRK
ncbi:MAG: hypothetical protein KKF78_06310 [Candidatus Omnitrophica bacterium]|nr:hypothetical protein [Candidatus Omnitrophota bacterium]MBU1996749.1 hypothetical protein [Candidatus Omnitrophota bacterium]